MRKGTVANERNGRNQAGIGSSFGHGDRSSHNTQELMVWKGGKAARV
jgi:hypothetical protein